jgi:hypothetical protein
MLLTFAYGPGSYPSLHSCTVNTNQSWSPRFLKLSTVSDLAMASADGLIDLPHITQGNALDSRISSL